MMRRFTSRLDRLEKDQPTWSDPRIEYLQRVAGKTRYQAISDLAEIFRIHLSRTDLTKEERKLFRQGLEKANARLAEEQRWKLENESADSQ